MAKSEFIRSINTNETLVEIDFNREASTRSYGTNNGQNKSLPNEIIFHHDLFGGMDDTPDDRNQDITITFYKMNGESVTAWVKPTEDFDEYLGTLKAIKIENPCGAPFRCAFRRG